MKECIHCSLLELLGGNVLNWCMVSLSTSEDCSFTEHWENSAIYVHRQRKLLLFLQYRNIIHTNFINWRYDFVVHLRLRMKEYMNSLNTPPQLIAGWKFSETDVCGFIVDERRHIFTFRLKVWFQYEAFINWSLV